jgi:predicted branched-subunit amino acid permease
MRRVSTLLFRDKNSSFNEINIIKGETKMKFFIIWIISTVIGYVIGTIIGDLIAKLIKLMILEIRTIKERKFMKVNTRF